MGGPDLLDDMRDATHMLDGARAVTIRKAKSTFSPVMPRAITDSNDGRSSGWMMSPIPVTETFDPGSNSKMRNASSDQL